MASSYDFWAIRGMGCFPLSRGHKTPCFKELPKVNDKASWEPLIDKPAGPEARERWGKEYPDHAIILGKRGFCFDFEDESIKTMIEDFNGFIKENYVVKTGKGWHVYFMIRLPKKPSNWCDASGKVMVEERTGNQYVVGEGSLHPSGATYQYMGCEDRELVILEDDIYEKFTKLFQKQGWVRRAAQDKANNNLEIPQLADIPKKPLPEFVDALIKNGVVKGGGRNNRRFILILTLIGYGYLDEVEGYILEFNKNCGEPEDETKCKGHIGQVMDGIKNGRYTPIMPEEEDEDTQVSYAGIQRLIEKMIIYPSTEDNLNEIVFVNGRSFKSTTEKLLKVETWKIKLFDNCGMILVKGSYYGLNPDTGKQKKYEENWNDFLVALQTDIPKEEREMEEITDELFVQEKIKNAITTFCKKITEEEKNDATSLFVYWEDNGNLVMPIEAVKHILKKTDVDFTLAKLRGLLAPVLNEKSKVYKVRGKSERCWIFDRHKLMGD